MTLKQARRIVDAWDAIEEEDPDITTELLMALTCERCGCDAGDVGEALLVAKRAKKVEGEAP